MVDNCPECNGFYHEDQSHKKPRFDQKPRGPIIREREVMIDTSQYMIGWGAEPCYVILQEEGFLPMSELNKLLLLKPLMNTHTVEIRRESLFMTTLISRGGAQEV